MDYFKQRRAYRNLKIYEADVSNGQNNLYRELLDYANDEGKLDNQFSMKNSALLSLTGLSETGLKKARNELVQLDLIDYTRGRKNTKAPQYKIIKLYQNNKSMVSSKDTRIKKSVPDGVATEPQKETLPETQLESHKELTVTDPDLTNKYEEGTDSPTPFETWENLWGFPNAIARDDLEHWQKDFSRDMVIYAITEAGKYNVQPKGADKYLGRVFDGWEERKITTVEQAKEASAKHQERMKSQYSKPKWRQNTPVQKETLPDWAKDDHQPAKTKIDPDAQEKLKKQLAEMRGE